MNITPISRIVLCTLLFALWLPSAFAQSLPPLSGRVIDAAGILSPSVEQQVTSKLAAHEANSGNQIVVYTINEPAAAGAYEALKAFGRENDVLIVSVDGGCPGVETIRDGVIGATSQQYPLLMASLGIEAIAAWAADGTKPAPTEGKDFFDTGVALVTDNPVDGVPSISVAEGLEKCWG